MKSWLLKDVAIPMWIVLMITLVYVIPGFIQSTYALVEAVS